MHVCFYFITFIYLFINLFSNCGMSDLHFEDTCSDVADIVLQMWADI